jgi:hypothetical protein
MYTDRAYGATNSWGFPDTWQIILEELRNDSPNHVPIGLHFDLFNNMPDVNNACDREDGVCGPMVDHVAGFASLQQQSSPNGETLASYNTKSSA